jgi:hypothetical protein
VIVFSNTITARLRYILDFIGKETIGEPFEITDDAEIFLEYNGPKINYSKESIADLEFQIHNTELLAEIGTREMRLECFKTSTYKAFFKTGGDFPFDIFAASFYLLSRYEEYLPHQKDIYGRYAHHNSLAYKEDFLHLPLINIWLEDFKTCLRTKFQSLSTSQSAFAFIPTYDIDEAYAYRHKQWWRTIGAMVKSIVNGHWSVVGQRLNVLFGKSKDPYDAFDWMDQLHDQYNLHPIYFFLVAARTGKYDKNILPSKPAMSDLVAKAGKRYSIGMHPSWQSGDDSDKLRFETLTLGHISGKQILSSRQHFIRFTLPGTYRQLIDLGIKSDFSMGYGSTNGFRASVASSFYWYDLEKERQTRLLLYPFCFMEANSFFEEKLSAQEALDELQQYYDIVKSVNGTLITIWHNSFLGSMKLFKGWREIYQRFIVSNKLTDQLDHDVIL